MQDRLTSLESLLREQQSRVTPEDYTTWLASAPTKALFLQLEIDLEDLKANWVRGEFASDDKQTRARAQAEYILTWIEGVHEIPTEND